MDGNVVDGCGVEWMDGRVDGLMGRWTVGWKDGGIDRWIRR